MAYYTCKSCNGKKTVEIGYMKHPCKECTGMGFVTIEDEKPVVEKKAAVVEQKESKTKAKKRGRPKKEVK